MEVYVYFESRYNKETEDDEILIPEVYATRQKAADRYEKAIKQIEIPPTEEIYDFVNNNDMVGGTGEYYLLDSDLRYICIYYKKVKVIE